MRHPRTILITGSSGLLGANLVELLGHTNNVVGFDMEGPPYPPIEAECITVDLTNEESLDRALQRVRHAYGNQLAAVVHLAAYYDFEGKESPLYDKLNVEGTRLLLRHLQGFEVGTFIFTGTMLVHKPCEPGERIDEQWPLEAKWEYPRSKIDAERVIEETAGAIPSISLRVAGVYDDRCRSIPLAHQIRRLHAEKLTSRLFPGDPQRGQAYVHLEDTISAIRLAIQRGPALPGFTPLLIGEEITLSYDEIQRTVSRLIHGEEVHTLEIPKTVAQVGAWVNDLNPFAEDRFIKPWMISMADDHYELDVTKARRLLGWHPQHSLRQTLPRMVRALKQDPVRWYKDNNLEPPEPVTNPEPLDATEEASPMHIVP